MNFALAASDGRLTAQRALGKSGARRSDRFLLGDPWLVFSVTPPKKPLDLLAKRHGFSFTQKRLRRLLGKSNPAKLGSNKRVLGCHMMRSEPLIGTC